MKSVVFVPYAQPGGISRERYTEKARERFAKMGLEVKSINGTHEDPKKVIQEAEAIVVGGGNTFALLNGLNVNRIVEPMQERIKSGVPYIGWSAGANLACPTIMTTNDMPIVQLSSFVALGVVPFQINPHYIDADPSSTHKGETRETRINEYLAFNQDRTVVGLREGTMLRLEHGVEQDYLYLKGANGAKIFRYGKEPQECQHGECLNSLLDED